MRFSVYLLLVLLLASCTYIEKKRGPNLSFQAHLLEGQTTTYSDILLTLGPPEQVSYLPDGFIFLYENFRVQEMQLNLGLQGKMIRWLQWFKISVAKSTVHREMVYFIFTPAGLLQTHNAHQWRKNLGYGGAVEFLFAVQSLIDTSFLEQPSYAHTWGMERLKPLPDSLYIEENLFRGTSGVEQWGTPELNRFLSKSQGFKERQR